MILLNFLYGIAAFVATVTAGSVVVALLSASVAFGVGVVGLVVAVNLSNALAEVGGVVTEQLLRPDWRRIDA